MLKKVTCMVLAGLLILTMLVGCGTSNKPAETTKKPEETTSTPTTPGQEQKPVHDTDFDNLNLTSIPGTGSTEKASDLPVPSGYTVVEYWYSVGAEGGAAIEEIAMDFNKTVGEKKKIWVVPTYQGNYDATAVKLESVFASGDVKSYPDLVNVNANGVIIFLDTPEFITFSDLAARDADFDMSKLNQNALASLTYKGKVLSYPQGISMPPLVFYNKDMFREAGLDPDNPPTTLAGYADIIPKLTKRNDKGEIEVYGMATSPELMHLHNFLLRQKGGEEMFDNANGHNGTPTKVMFGENGSMLNFLNEWKKLIDTGCIDYFSDARVPPFRNKKTAIVMVSSLQIMNLINTPPDFEFGVATVPYVKEDDHKGQQTGGSSVFIIDRGEKQLDATWQFLKFMALPEPSAKWFLGSGYYPLNMDAFNLPEVKEYFNKNPQLNILTELYEQSKGKTFLSPIWVPSFGDLNQFYKDTIIRFGNGEVTAEEAVKLMVDESQRVIENYNRLNK